METIAKPRTGPSLDGYRPSRARRRRGLGRTRGLLALLLVLGAAYLPSEFAGIGGGSAHAGTIAGSVAGADDKRAEPRRKPKPAKPTKPAPATSDPDDPLAGIAEPSAF